MKREHIGIVLGFICGGIIGAIFGGFAGKNFDKAKTEGWSKRRKATVCVELGFLVLFGTAPLLYILI